MTNMIEVAQLTKTFGDFTAVRDVSFSVGEGEIFAFLGPNGAGKSTTIKMLTTLQRPTSGTIRIAGRDPVREAHEVRRTFGIVFQDSSLDDELTAWENLDFHGVLYSVPKDIRRKRMEELLDLVDLTDRRNGFVREFSGGMKRRLEMARGLLHRPKILFLDEPTLGLDPQTRNHLWRYIGRLNTEERVTVFFTTHYMEEADNIAGRIAVIDHGTLVAEGTGVEIKQRTGAETLEAAFLALTGNRMRDEAADPFAVVRQARRR